MYVRLSQTIGQNLCITVIPKSQILHKPFIQDMLSKECDLHLLTSLHPIHQAKHCMLAGIDSKSSASGMQQIRVLHLSGTQKTPV